MHHCRYYITSFLTRKKLQKCYLIKNQTTINFDHILVVALLVLIFLIKGHGQSPTVQRINTNESNYKLQLKIVNQILFINEISDYHQRTAREFVKKLNLTFCDFHTEMFEQFSQGNADYHSCCHLLSSIYKKSKRSFCVLEKKIRVFSISSSKSYRIIKNIPLYGVKSFFSPYYYSLDIRITEGDISVICFVNSYEIRYNTRQEKSTVYLNRLSINHERNKTRYKRYTSERGTKIHDIVSRGSNGISNNAIKL